MQAQAQEPAPETNTQLLLHVNNSGLGAPGETPIQAPGHLRIGLGATEAVFDHGLEILLEELAALPVACD